MLKDPRYLKFYIYLMAFIHYAVEIEKIYLCCSWGLSDSCYISCQHYAFKPGRSSQSDQEWENVISIYLRRKKKKNPLPSRKLNIKFCIYGAKKEKNNILSVSELMMNVFLIQLNIFKRRSFKPWKVGFIVQRIFVFDQIYFHKNTFDNIL